MRKLLLASVIAAAFAAPAAHADVHGCISVGGVASVTSGNGGPVHQNTTCDFAFVAGDTYSGGGPFSIECTLNTVKKKITHAATDAPVTQAPLSCDGGVTVTVTLQPGAIVAAGNVQ